MDMRVEVIQSMTGVPDCMSISQIQQVTLQDRHLQWLKNNTIAGWPAIKDQLLQDIRPYWSYKDELSVIDGVVMKCRWIIIPEVLRQQALDELCVNHMGIEKTKL